jgi:CheY-like chemotaxis protein
VVDDNATNLKILEEVLRGWRMRPTLVDGAAAALAELQRARQLGEPFSLVLTDCHMPGMDGFMLAEQIRQNPEMTQATIIMLTSGAPPDAYQLCREIGIADHVVKPVRPDDLQARILTVLGKGQAVGGLPAARPAPRPEAVDRRLRVLVAEDNVVNQRLAMRLLENRGHEVVIACNGREAVSKVAEAEFDVVLMDVQMPEMDGLSAAAAIRKREQPLGRHVLIIATTARALPEDRGRCLAAGMDGYVSKPIDARQLFDLIDTLLAESPATEGVAEHLVFDEQQALATMDHDRQMLCELAALFLEECPRLLGGVRAAVEAQDAARLERAAHALKSSASTFFAREVLDSAERLEGFGRQATLQDAAARCAQLEAQLDELCAALQTWLSRDGGSDTGPV